MSANKKYAAIYRRAAAAIIENAGITISAAVVWHSKVSTRRVRINAARRFWNIYPEYGPFYIDPNHAPIALLMAAEITLKP